VRLRQNGPSPGRAEADGLAVSNWGSRHSALTSGDKIRSSKTVGESRWPFCGFPGFEMDSAPLKHGAMNDRLFITLVLAAGALSVGMTAVVVFHIR
jgi:hypothetical protein